MASDIIFSSENIVISRRIDGFYIESFRGGMTLDQFNNIINRHPEIKITSFMAIKNALLFAPKPPAKFGEEKEKIFVEISSDELRAYITLCVPETEFSGDRKAVMIKEVIRKLHEKGVVFGIKHDVLLNHLANNRQMLVAEGLAPINGEDSKVRMYEMKEVKPEIKEDGNVDHYELNLINKVSTGNWLGERLDPTNGTPGKTVKGNSITPMPGKKYPLLYDKKSVKEVYQDGVTTLHAGKSGAVTYQGDRISVSDFLEIGENVDFKTGNINFEGYLTVKGSVEDSFSVAADKDIEILGDYGVGSVREIVSREGSVYIKGGVAGKNKAVIRSKKDIYTKFISDATVICEGSVHVGFYILNSNITAKQVILDSTKGQIIGGNIKAEIKVVSSIIGSPSEKRTVIAVKGFDRWTLKEKLEGLTQRVETLKAGLTKTKQEISIYSNSNGLTKEQINEYEKIKDRYFTLRDTLKDMEDERKALVNYLRTHGEGEVAILKKAYPSTVLEIKRMIKELDRVVLNTSFYALDGEIKEL